MLEKSKVFDRNALLAEIEENEKMGYGGNSGNSQKEDDTNLEKKDFFYEKKENEYGESEKNTNKDLYKNPKYYDFV